MVQYAPGKISASEVATGLLIRAININGNYIIVENFDLSPVQEVEELYLIQGGPRSAIGNIGLKHLEGQISCPVRVDNNGNLEAALWSLLDNAQNPDTPLVIQTNHTLSYFGLTAEHGGSNSNQLVNLDCCVVKELTLNATNDLKSGVKLTASIVGTIDTNTPTVFVSPPDDYLLHRQLSFADCDASRYESDMRTVSQLEIKINNDVKLEAFLVGVDGQRFDQPQVIGIAECKWTGHFEEILRKGVEVETFIHGGFMQNENLQFQFGPITATIKVPMFKIATQPLTANYLKRKTEFFAQIFPIIRNSAGDLFSYTEN